MDNINILDLVEIYHNRYPGYFLVMNHSKSNKDGFVHYDAFVRYRDISTFSEFDDYLMLRKKEEKSGVAHDFHVSRVVTHSGTVRVHGLDLYTDRLKPCFDNVWYRSPYYHRLSFKNKNDEIMRLRMSLSFNVEVYENWVTYWYYDKYVADTKEDAIMRYNQSLRGSMERASAS